MISSSTRGVGDPTVGTLIKSQLWKDAFNDDLMEVDVKVGALGEENLVSARRYRHVRNLQDVRGD